MNRSSYQRLAYRIRGRTRRFSGRLQVLAQNARHDCQHAFAALFVTALATVIRLDLGYERE